MQEIITTSITPKYELTTTISEEQKLKIYFMTVVTKATGQHMKSVGIISYRHIDAMKKGISMYVTGNPVTGIISNEEDSELIENIIKNINFEGITIVRQEPLPSGIIQTIEKEKKVMPIETFKAGLKMAAIEYVKNEMDRKMLLEIINTIKV
jgi:hypothetical protein